MEGNGSRRASPGLVEPPGFLWHNEFEAEEARLHFGWTVVTIIHFASRVMISARMTGALPPTTL